MYPNVLIRISRKNLFDQPIKNYKITYENIRKVAIDQGDYKTSCLLDYPFLKIITK